MRDLSWQEESCRGARQVGGEAWHHGIQAVCLQCLPPVWAPVPGTAVPPLVHFPARGLGMQQELAQVPLSLPTWVGDPDAALGSWLCPIQPQLFWIESINL